MWRITKLIIKAIKEIREFNRLDREILELQKEMNQYDRERLEELTRKENEWLDERIRLSQESSTQWEKSWNEIKALSTQIDQLQEENLNLSSELKSLQNTHAEEMEQYSGLKQDLFKASESKQIAGFQVISVVKIAERIWYDCDFVVYFLEKGKLGTMQIVLRPGASRNSLMKQIADCRTREEVLKHDEHENIYYD